MGPASELLSQKRGGFCPFPCSHLTVAENWREADQLGQDPSSEFGELKLYAGERGKAQAKRLLNAAAAQLETEVWGLGHALSCPWPKDDTRQPLQAICTNFIEPRTLCPQRWSRAQLSSEDSLEATADRLVTKGVRLVHFGCLEDAQEQLTKVQELLDGAGDWSEVHQRLSLAATLTDLFLQQRRGRGDKARQRNGECMEAFARLESRSASARPLACWHNLPLLLRATEMPSHSLHDFQRQRNSPWPNFEATGANDPEFSRGGTNPKVSPMVVNLDHAGIAFLMVVVAGLSTCLGASAVFFNCLVQLASRRVLAAGLGFSSGIMLYVSFIEIFQKAKDGFTTAGIEEKHAYMTLAFSRVMCFVTPLCSTSHLLLNGKQTERFPFGGTLWDLRAYWGTGRLGDCGSKW
eukprot:g2394.t1